MALSRLSRSLISAQRGPFLERDGSGGGGGETGVTGATGPTGPNDANSSGNGGTGATGAGEVQKVEPVTFVHEGKTYVLQDHANKLIGDARKEGRTAAQSEAQRKADEAAAKAAGDWQKLATDREARITALEADVAQRDKAALRDKVGRAEKLPDALIELLKGDDEAQLTAHAKELAKHVKPPTAAETEAGSGNRGSGNGLSTRQGDAKAEDNKEQSYAFIPRRAVPIPQ